MNPSVTICIPTIPPRSRLLSRAVTSVVGQTRPVQAIAISSDTDHAGAWANRNAAVRMARTEWLGFLDDDDELLPFHVELLLDAARAEGADMVWGWFEVVTPPGMKSGDPFPQHRGRQYNPADPHIVPITYLVKRELIWQAVEECGGFLPDTIGAWENQDMPVIQRMCELGGKLHAVNDITWLWHHHGMGEPGRVGNTSGLPGRW